jgi:hypothetical protein
VVRAPMAPVHTTDGPTSLVADGALYRADTLQKLSATQMTWITRVPATWREAQAPLAQAEPQTMAPLTEGERSHACTATDGEVAPRGMRLDAEARHRPAPHPVDTPLSPPRAKAPRACPHRCRPALACEPAAQQARSTFQHGFHRT